MITDKLQDDFSADIADYEETVAGWTDKAVLALANLKIPTEQSDRMSILLEHLDEGKITDAEERELEVYRTFTDCHASQSLRNSRSRQAQTNQFARRFEMSRISRKIREKIIHTAKNRCGYCRTPQDLVPIPFEIEPTLCAT